MTTTAPIDLIDFRHIRTTPNPASALRFACMDDADKTTITLQHLAYGPFPQAHFTRHPHDTDRARGFAVTTSPGRWLAE